MTRDDYEERRERLDEELRAGIELLQAAHAAQARAQELVWMSSGDQAPAVAPPPRGADGARRPVAEKLFAVEVSGEGTRPTTYRKL